MMKIVWNNRFKRAFRKLIKKNPELQEKIINALYLLGNDPFTPSLKSHKLTGSFKNFIYSLIACFSLIFLLG